MDRAHTHTGSLDWMECHICNPNIKPKVIAYGLVCKKCNEVFTSRKKLKKKKQICKNCK